MRNTEPKHICEIIDDLLIEMRTTSTAATTFYDWLAANAGSLAGNSAGDFASDAAADEFFPAGIDASAAGFAAVFNYLYYGRRVSIAVIDAFMECWAAFFRATTGERWEAI